MTNPPSEEERIRACVGGDYQAFEPLVEHHREKIFRYLATMTGDDALAQDLTQETFIKAWQNLSTFKGQAKLSSWLFSIAINLARNAFRQRGRSDRPASAADLGEHASTRRSVLSSIIRRESALALELAMDRLPPSLKEAFVLHVIEGMPYADMAATTGDKENALQVRVHRARALLKKQLGAVLDDLPGSREK